MSKQDIDKFYQSREWTEFARLVKEERAAAKGGNYCERCGKRVADTRKLIAHHKKHLNSYNINDPFITFNKDNVEIICYQCHNEEHNRFISYAKQKAKKKVYIVYGPPLAGKSTIVNQRMEYGDLIVNQDLIYQAISGQEMYDKPKSLLYNMFKIQDLLIEQIRVRFGNWNHAYIIGGYPDKIKREKLRDALDAELVKVVEPREVCYARLESNASGRSVKLWKSYIDKWFEEYTE